MLTIDEIKIEGEEDGFHLVIYAENQDGAAILPPFRYRIGLPDQFHAETVRTIGRWLDEGEAARPLGPGPGWVYRSGAPYPGTDPKHPDYHDTMSGIHDNRKGK